MKVDSTFHIGQVHVHSVSPCQDYAAHRISPDGAEARIVVSDGCSTGGHTDVGSRLIALRALSRSVCNIAELDIGAMHLEFFGLKLSDLLATQIVAAVSNGVLTVSLQGDGVVAWIWDDDILFDRYEWDNNIPFYPIYNSAMGQEAGLERSFQNAHVADFPLTVTRSQAINGELYPLYEYKLPRHQHLLSRLPYQETSGMRGVALFSDGICQVRNGAGELLPWEAAARDCLEFKSTTGDFVKRRVRRAIQNWAKTGFVPQDDLSVAVLLAEEI